MFLEFPCLTPGSGMGLVTYTPSILASIGSGSVNLMSGEQYKIVQPAKANMK